MCIRFNFPDRMNRNVLWENGINRFQKFLPVKVKVQINMTNLHAGMNARIRPPATHDGNWKFEIGGKSGFKAFLHREGIFLDLPTVKLSSFIAQFKKVSLAFDHKDAKILFRSKSWRQTCVPWY